MHDRFARLMVAVACVVLGAALVSCNAAAGSSPSASRAVDADVTIKSHGLAFDQMTLTVAAGRPFKLQFVNEDSVPHNVAIYVDSTASQKRFVGEFVTAATILYAAPALEAGTYFFRCDLHPDMKGALTAAP
jgi:plastocyanin